MSPKIANKKGFTLVELLVTMTIIAILSTIGYSMYRNAQMTARDSRRKQDFKSLEIGLELYKQQHGHYPYSQPYCGADGSGCDRNQNNWPHSNVGAWSALSGLVPDYLPALPVDPINNTQACFGAESWSGANCFAYDYWSGLSDNTNFPDCSQGSGQVYVLTTRLENTEDPDGIGNGAQHDFCGIDIRFLRGGAFPNNEYIKVGS